MVWGSPREAHGWADTKKKSLAQDSPIDARPLTDLLSYLGSKPLCTCFQLPGTLSLLRLTHSWEPPASVSPSYMQAQLYPWSSAPIRTKGCRELGILCSGSQMSGSGDPDPSLSQEPSPSSLQEGGAPCYGLLPTG